MVTENISIDVRPGGVPVVIHVTQYEAGLRQFVFTPYTSGGTLTAVAGSATLEGTKPDGYAFQQACEMVGGVITYTLQEQLCAVEGRVWSRLVIRDINGGMIGYTAIVWVVGRAGVKDDAIMSDSDISALRQFLDEFGTIDAYRGALNGALAAVGGPLVAATASAMTDTTKVYVYTGSESGYTEGHWYYWNGSAWTDGGVYQATGINTDKTLTVEDMAADAKATGDAVVELKNELDVVSPNAQGYPHLYRGTINVNNGAISPSSSVLNRLFSDAFNTASYDRIRTKVGINAYVVYYNSDMTYAGNSGGFKTNDITVNQTYSFARVMLAKSDGSDFAEVLTDGALVYNSSQSCLIDSRFEDIMTATDAEKNLYAHSAASTNFSHTVRWFVPQPAPPNSIIKDIHVYSGGGGTLTVELWEKNKTTFTRVSSYSFVTATETVDAKNVFDIGYKTGDNSIYISMHGSWGAVLKGSTGNGIGVPILRDISATSFSESSLENMAGFLIAVDVKYYSLPTNRTYKIGQYDNVAEVITEALKYMDSTVYIEPYTHDCVQEWESFFGSGYWENFSSGRGIELKNNIHIIGRSGCTLQCHYTGNNDFVQSNFSLFNNCGGGSGYTIENVIFDTSKIRYVIHDERGNDVTPYKVRYSRCQMTQDNSESTWDRSRACIGGGLGAHGDVVVEDCVFDTVVSTANKDSIAYHNSESEEAQSSLIIKNCYCKGTSTLQLASYGASTKKTMVMVANCSFGSAIEELDWTSGSPNLDIYYINNVVRN